MASTHTPTKAPRKALLTDTAVRNAKPQPKPYKLPDAGGLFLLVQPTGAKLWRYRFWLHSREGLQALGQYPEISLAAARKRHAEARELVANGVNPVHAQQQAKLQAKLEQQRSALGTFGAAVKSWREHTDPELRPASVRQRAREIETDLMPQLRNRELRSIGRVELVQLLKAVQDRPAREVARNLRTHLQAIFEHAANEGLVDANPTPPRSVLQKRRQKPHAALPEDRMGEFLVALDRSSINPETRAAMLLILLTACRKSEITGMRWGELNLDEALLTIPPERMKAKREHLVPLPRQAVQLLREVRESAPPDREFVFPNRHSPKRPMHNRSTNAVLERLGYGGEATIHGWRSVFSSKYNEAGVNPDVIERCLAHAHENAVRAAYNRAAYLPQRRELLQQWADWLDGEREKAKAKMNSTV